VELYRIEQTKYGAQLNGEGAFQVGGRWNYKQTRMLYTSTSRSLCILETLVHSAGLTIKQKYSLLTISVDDSLIVKVKKLPDSWNSLKTNDTTRQIGTDFIKEGKSLGLMVPSVIVPEEYNVLLNVLHPKMAKAKLVSVDAFNYDMRLV